MSTQDHVFRRRLLFLLSFLLLLILLIMSLNNQSSVKPVEEKVYDTSPPSSIPAERLLSIPLLSAGATAPGSQVDYLFDQQAETHWLLARGNGPGECLEINFLPQNMPFLGGIRVIPAIADTLATIKKIALYVNHELTAIKEGDFNFPVGQKVFALRLCIESTTADEEYSYMEDDHLIKIHTLPTGEQTGLQSILFFNKQGQAYFPLPPKYISAKVLPSSNLNPISAFHAGQLFDGNPNSAWIEGDAASPSGSFLNIQLAEAIQPSFLALWNGFQLSDQHYQNNSRAAGITLQMDNAPSFSFECRDQTGGQVIRLPSNLKLRSFSLHIDRTYRGTRYPETALSELFFMDGPQAIVLKTDWPQRIQQEVSAEIQQTPLRLYLNRAITNRIEHSSGDFHHRKKLYIAADGHFYAQIERNELSQKHITKYSISGHWELQDASETNVRLRLFGKVEQTDFATNATPTFKEELFNEVIDIQMDRIDGGETLGIFYLR